MYYAQVLQSLDSSLIGIQVELILCTQCLTLLPKVCCSFIKTSNFFSNKISPLLNWIMKYDIVRMLSRLLLSKEKYAPFFSHAERQPRAIPVFGVREMQVFLERFPLPPVNISHLFSPPPFFFFGEKMMRGIFFFFRK